jgi:hypothetical protein
MDPITIPTPDLPGGRQVQLPSGTSQTLSQMLNTAAGAASLAATNIDSQLDSSGNAIEPTDAEGVLVEALSAFQEAIGPWISAYQAEGC